MTPKEMIKALLAKGYSQHQLARKCGISQPAISKIAAYNKPIMLSTYESIKKAYDAEFKERKK